MEYETVIGLEVHAQLKTRSKIFCGCSTAFGAPPNSQTCPICLGMPGVLPVVNKRAVEFLLRLAIACGSEVASHSRFARKNYFYPDLPKAYQISQYELPLATGGRVDIEADGEARSIRLVRIHIEEDAGKLIHGENLGDPDSSYVDLNRAGTPLLEIVSEPDLRSPAEAREYMQKLRTLVQYLDICDGNMEEGSLRCDANISVRPAGSQELGTKTELKNLNSFRFLQKAIEYERDRQIRVLEKGGKVVQETRLWDQAQGVTQSMRTKEYAHDYRYFPDPDLVPLVIEKEWLEEVRASLPELPDAKGRRFVAQYGIPAYNAKVLTTSRDLADYYERAVRAGGSPKVVSNWVMGDLLGALNAAKREAADSPVLPESLAGLVRLIEDGTITGKIAKTVFEEMFRTGKEAAAIVKEQGLTQITDAGPLAAAADEVLSAHPKEVADYKGGKTKLLGFFVGQVMKATQGKGNPQAVQEILKKKLSE
ncbi:MAG: Asp-tRNA(Asn)/Glu-tRNA(Gln) amidotransferase subunit GatB [Candidatus Tectomicrobia bacterium]|nr:Asp-tRNA(Asn)/Glu-tRNA(Gln) amidotransferase subunit GatB [Candidatus Tectomicrobia bacterium]